MQLLLEALGFGVAVALIVAGIIGILLPILPGTLMIWLTVLIYAITESFETIDWITFSVITLIAFVTGTAELWMVFLGAKSSGASWQSMFLGFVGAIAGLLVLGTFLPVIGSVIGGIAGYSIGVLLGQYLRLKEWRPAFRAALGSLAGWGVATAIQVGGGLIILLLFVWQVLKA